MDLYGKRLHSLKLLSIKMKEYEPQTFRALDQLPGGLTLNKATIKHDTTEDQVNYLLSEILLNWKPARSRLTLFQLPKKGSIKFDISIENFNLVVIPTSPSRSNANQERLYNLKIKEMKLSESVFEFEDRASKHRLRIENGFNHGEFKV